MAHFYFHSLSSAREYGGDPSIYYPIHAWFDSTKQNIVDARHRLVLHHLGGVSLALKIFGDYTTYTNEANEEVKVSNYLLGLQHISEDFGRTMYAEEILEYFSRHLSGLLIGFNQEQALVRVVKKHRGTKDDYVQIVDFFSSFIKYWNHDPLINQVGLTLMCNTFGIFQLEKLYGPLWTRPSDGKQIPTRIIGENYVNGGFGFIPTLNEIVEKIPTKSWMYVNAAALSFQFDGNKHDNISNEPVRSVPSPLPLD